jgi:hypothetical protein
MARAANGILCANDLVFRHNRFFLMTNNHERNKRTAAAADCLMAARLPSASANTIASLHIKSITFL